jgi:hypothetical protein
MKARALPAVVAPVLTAGAVVQVVHGNPAAVTDIVPDTY